MAALFLPEQPQNASLVAFEFEAEKSRPVDALVCRLHTRGQWLGLTQVSSGKFHRDLPNREVPVKGVRRDLAP